MKQMYVAVCLLLLLAGCGQSEENKAETATVQEIEGVETETAGQDAKEKAVTTSVESATVKEIDVQAAVKEQKNILSNYDTVLEVYLSNTKVPDLFSIRHDDTYSYLRIDSYNSKINAWETVYSKDDHEHFGVEKFDVLEVATTPAGLEQIAVGYHAGSGGYLNFLIFGNTGQGVGSLFDGMYKDYYGANIYAKAAQWEIIGENGLLETIPY